MNPIISYLLQVVGISAIMYGYYHIALRNKKFHRYNRFYVIIAAVLSIIIPFFHIPIYFTAQDTGSYKVLNLLGVVASDKGEVIISSTSTSGSWFTLQHLSYILYFLIAAVFLFRILRSFLAIRKIINNHPVEYFDRIKFVNTNEPGTPFSFFRWLFWNKKIALKSEKGEQIFRHEYFHIEQKHTRDILFLEILTAIFWFNPFFHLMKKEVRAIHEFLADEFAVKENKKWNYAELLLMQVLNTNTSLVNPFFNNQIKRRIAMITKTNKTSFQYLRKLLVLPLAAIIAILFAFSYKSQSNKIIDTALEKPVTIVIDAGHGGNDPGATSADGTAEKNITLAIAKKVKALNQNGNIKIILTRDNDILPSLKSRTELTIKENPSLFISLHVNNENNDQIENKTGFEFYISKKNRTFYTENQILGTILQKQISNLFYVDKNLKQRNAGIWVLDQAPCPAVLLECGYMSNPKDLAFITNTANQDEIAKSILAGINQYLIQNKNDETPKNNFTLSDTTKPLNKVFDKVEVEASFPGGPAKWREFLMKNLNPSAPKNTAKKGIYTVIVQFIVDEHGKISNLKALTHHGYGMEEEAIRVLQLSPNWTPAIQNGRIVKAYRKQPITFHIGPNYKKSKTDEDAGIDSDNSSISPASFPGGKESWRKYLENNAKAAIPSEKGAPPGTYTTKTQFIVNTDGSISDIKSLTNFGYGMEEEALRLIATGPKWQPAMQNGKAVKSYVQQPVTFQIIEELDVTNRIPEISVRELQNATAKQILQIPDNVKLDNFIVSTDNQFGDIVEVSNNTNDFSQAGKRMLQNYLIIGNLIYFDNIIVLENKIRKKLPSKVFKIKN
ncbi:MAG: N-acetylmuramoyl-L-alanine amidase [Chitinophagaceae bacterium]